MNKLITTLALVTSFFFAAAQEKTATLHVGSPAPELRVQEWIKGTPIRKFEKGKVYLVELSATWCGPCRAFIPHLAEITKKYLGRLQVISVYTQEVKKNLKDLGYVQGVREMLSTIEERSKSELPFAIAVDIPEDYFAENWLYAAGHKGIPFSFLVDENGKIAWMGHPGNAEPILEAKFSGQSIETVAADRKREEEANQAKMDRVLLTKQGVVVAINSLDSMIRLYPEREYLYFNKFLLLQGVNDPEAYQSLQTLLKLNPQNFDWYHLISMSVNESNVRQPNYEIAHQIADRAVQQSETTIVKAYAWLEKAYVYNLQYRSNLIKDLKSAVDAATRALETAKEVENITSDVLIYFEDQLQAYKKRQRELINK